MTTISNDLEFNLSLLAQMKTEGRNKSKLLELLLTSTSETSFIKDENESVTLLEFIQKDIIIPRFLEQHIVEYQSSFLERIEIAVEFFHINLDYFPQELNREDFFPRDVVTLENSKSIYLITFLVTILLPIKYIELRLIILNSSIFDEFTRYVLHCLSKTLLCKLIQISFFLH